MTTSRSSGTENSVRSERNVLGELLINPAKWDEVRTLDVDHFLLNDHKKIFSAGLRLRERNLQPDMNSLWAELGNGFRPDYFAELMADVSLNPQPQLPQYVQEVREAARNRKLAHLFERAVDPAEWPALLPQIKAVLDEEPTDTGTDELIVIRGDQVSEKPLRYSWKPYLPVGKLVHVGGVSSQAKSPMTVDLAARISTGADWPDGTKNTQGPKSIIMLNVEDDYQDTILPRFRLAGGDKSKLHYVQGVRIASGASNLERMFTLETDMQRLVRLARTLPDLGLIVIDPVTNYLGGKKFIDEADVRSILTPLANLAAELRIVIITVGHFNRREKGTDPTHRFMGAAAFVGVARAVYACGPDPEAESKYAHVMATVRGCGGEGSALRYHTELVTDHCPDSEPNEIIKVVWDGTSDATAEDSVDPVSTKDKSQEDEAAQLLKEFLMDGMKSAHECAAFLKAEGHDLEKLNSRRVRRKAGADSKKLPGDKFNSWYLTAPGGLIQ